MDTNSLTIDGINIPRSNHPTIRKLKRKTKVQYLHGNKVWNTSLVLMDMLKDLPNVNTKILDLGCGWGLLSCYLHKKGADVTGMDTDISVKPYFDFMCEYMSVEPKFVLQDIFNEKLSLDYDVYVACDMCFWESHVEKWLDIIDHLLNNNKKLILADPGRESFWNLLELADKYGYIFTHDEHSINIGNKTSAYIVIFGEDGEV